MSYVQQYVYQRGSFSGFMGVIMEKTILIQNEDRSIKAEILPDYGGMVVRLQVDGHDVLYFDETGITDSPLTSGGIPVLFPFAGKTKNDTYEIGGKKFYMPMHGLVKNRSFAIKDLSGSSITLWIKEDETILSRNYPFFHTLEITYQIKKDTLVITARVENHSQQPMPHAIGWHPYFKASDGKQIKLTHYMEIHYDYVHLKDFEAPESIELNKDWDDVFCQPQRGEYSLVNTLDGYKVRCIMDKAYRTIVVYTGKPGSVCVEPWCGIPDSIHNGRMLEWIPAGKSKDYVLKFQLKAL
jgi:galactose mutarotase-like enzyme